MHFRQSGIIILASSLGLGFSSGAALAQDAKQDVNIAGTDTKDATKDVGHDVAKGTKKAYHSTAHGTKVAADKTADTSKTIAHKTSAGTKKTVDKVEGKLHASVVTPRIPLKVEEWATSSNHCVEASVVANEQTFQHLLKACYVTGVLFSCLLGSVAQSLTRSEP